MIGYGVSVKCVNVTQRTQPQSGVVIHDGSVDIIIRSPEGEISLQIAFAREHSLDDAVRGVLRRVANWARYIAQAAEDEIGHERAVATEHPMPVLAVA